MNRAVLIGRITKDVELRYTPNNVAVIQFTVAVDRRYKAEGQPQADFINCVAWRNTAEFISKYFSKGSRIAIVGSIQTRSWEDNDGNRHYVTEVVVDEAEFCESKKQQSNDYATTEAGYNDGADESNDDFSDGYYKVDDEGVPF